MKSLLGHAGQGLFSPQFEIIRKSRLRVLKFYFWLKKRFSGSKLAKTLLERLLSGLIGTYGVFTRKSPISKSEKAGFRGVQSSRPEGG